jgi:hypothetical protein
MERQSKTSKCGFKANWNRTNPSAALRREAARLNVGWCSSSPMSAAASGSRIRSMFNVTVGRDGRSQIGPCQANGGYPLRNEAVNYVYIFPCNVYISEIDLSGDELSDWDQHFQSDDYLDGFCRMIDRPSKR